MLNARYTREVLHGYDLGQNRDGDFFGPVIT
jgi:hypothetical protein